MRKNIIKISLDVVMAGILILLYNSHAISLAFHEIAGLFLFGLFVIHCLLNRKWVTSITAKFFSKSIAPRVRFGYIIDLMLLVSFVLIIFSGISTSQVLFPSLAQAKDSPWRSVHHFFAALSIILVGIHLGLHWNFVTGMFKKAIRIPQKLAKPLSIGLLLIVLVFGTYSTVASSFTGWLAEPFIAAGKSGTSDSDTEPAKNEDKSSWDGIVNGDKPGEGSPATEESSPSASGTDAAPTAEPAKNEDKSSWDGIVNGDKPGESDATTGAKKEIESANGQTGKPDENKSGTTVEPTAPEADGEEGGDTAAHPAGEKKSEEGSPAAIVGTVATYLSILGVFSAITYYIDKLLKKKKRTDGKSN
ncbi:MAG: DUF4405 domain-containing protein [Oscillospiraceae bacterium]|jgi:hypothetical protein|nr:DUF4405 domain-containing protein [Oscillospiraceae bacterium]